MTAICLYRSDEVMLFASDGLSYDRAGRVVGYVTKLYPLPHLNSVFTHAGAGRIGVVIIDLINRGMVDHQFDSFDALMERFIPLCQEAHRVTERMLVDEFGDDVDESYTKSTFVIGGWSHQAGRFEAFKTSSYNKEIHTGEDHQMISTTDAWTLQRIDDFYINSWPESRVEEFGLSGDVPVLDLMARAICACRAESRIDDEGVYCVGGYLQMVYLNTTKVVSWIAHRWPDPIGEIVDVSRGERLPNFPIVVP